MSTKGGGCYWYCDRNYLNEEALEVKKDLRPVKEEKKKNPTNNPEYNKMKKLSKARRKEMWEVSQKMPINPHQLLSLLRPLKVGISHSSEIRFSY